ncbi:MAG: hypothetical protein ABH864_02445 [archaeon]
MNNWILPTAFVVLVLIVGAFTFVNAQDDAVAGDKVVQEAGSCGVAGCSGGCTAESNCGSSSCGATSGGICGCGRR